MSHATRKSPSDICHMLRFRCACILNLHCAVIQHEESVEPKPSVKSLIRLGDAHADLSPCWLHMSDGLFSWHAPEIVFTLVRLLLQVIEWLFHTFRVHNEFYSVIVQGKIAASVYIQFHVKRIQLYLLPTGNHNLIQFSFHVCPSIQLQNKARARLRISCLQNVYV